MPESHFVQGYSPALDFLPIAQLKHEEAFEVDVFPALQFVHKAASPEENLPALQFRQEVEPPPEYVPLPQDSQVGADLELISLVPAAHKIHEEEPVEVA